MVSDFTKGDGSGSERQSCCHHDKAHRLVEDHSFQGGKPEHTDQERQPGFRTSKADHAAKTADNRPSAKGGRKTAFYWGRGQSDSLRKCTTAHFKDASINLRLTT